MKQFKTFLIIFLFLSSFLCQSFALENQQNSQSSQNSQNVQNLPSGFRKIQLGMTLEEVKLALQKDSQFGYRGDRDVSLLPSDNQTLIETDTSRTAPYSFLNRCWFQFYEGRLYTITLNLKQEKLDHYSIFSTLCQKYGNPNSLDPEKSEWKNDSVIMTLERPLTLKYVDKNVFDELLEKSLVEKSAQEITREMFLDEL